MTLLETKLSELRKLKTLLEQQQSVDAEIARAKVAESDYRHLARANQLPPDGEDWLILLILAGRGFGKTWTGARLLLEWLRLSPGDYFIAAPTFGLLKRVCFEGPSGIVAALDKDELVIGGYNRTEMTLKFKNGSRVYGLSADTPDSPLGLNLSGGWCDEMAAWPYDEMWTRGLAPALRIGKSRVVITTTPRPTKLIKDFMGRTDGSVAVIRGSTFDNQANLSEAALNELRGRYEGTRLGRQELYGEILEDVEGALWTLESLQRAEVPEMVRVVVAVDPATTSGEDSDETGIVVVGKGVDGFGYVLADRSCRDTPNGWARRAIAAYEEFGADRIVAEKNQGGDMVEQTLRSVSNSVSYKGITAKVGKRLRAEPVAALYEQHRIFHCGVFEHLENQMLEWVPDSGYSPDRLDALVHGITELGFTTGGMAGHFFEQLANANTPTTVPARVPHQGQGFPTFD